jgi:uncharacterized protein (DUF58 family)
MINRKVVMLLLLALAMFLIATNVQAGLLFLVSAALVGLIIVSYLVPLITTRRLSITRHAPDEAFEGIPVVIRAEVVNHGRVPRFLINVEDVLARGGGGTVVWLPRAATRSVTYETALPRGVYSTAELTAGTRAPFGVWSRTKKVDAGAGLIVYPRYEEISTFPLLEAMSSPFETVHERRSPGTGFDYLGTREYRRGDSMRVVHWRSSARRGELVVKEFEEELSTPVSILIDRSVGSEKGPAGDSTFDAAARITATLANYCLKAGHPLRLFSQDKNDFIKVERPGFYPTLEWLAGLRADGQRNVADLVEETTLYISHRSTVILIATSQTAAWAEIAAAVQARRARFIVVLVDAQSYGDKVAPSLADIAEEIAGERVTFYAYEKGQDVRDCLREPLNVTGR